MDDEIRPAGEGAPGPQTDAGRALADALDRRSDRQLELSAATSDLTYKLALAGATLVVLLARSLGQRPALPDLVKFLQRLGYADVDDSLARVTEAVVRSALRDEAHLTVNITERDFVEAEGMLLARVVDDLRLSQTELVSVIVTAERMITDMGLTGGVAATDLRRIEERLEEDLAEPSGPDFKQLSAHLEWVPLPAAAPSGEDGPVPGGPQTIFGLYLRANVTDQSRTLWKKWNDRLEQTGNTNLAQGVWAAFLVGLYRRFQSLNLEDIAAFIERVHRFVLDAPGQGWPLESEFFLRAAVAERFAPGQRFPVGAMPIPVTHMRLALAIAMILDLRLSIAGVDALIAEAEALTARNGYPLTPATQ